MSIERSHSCSQGAPPATASRRRHVFASAILALILILGLSADLAAQDSVPPALELTPEEEAFLEEHPVIRIAPYAEYPPAEFIDERGRHRGIAAEYIERIEAMLGIEFEHVDTTDWQDILDKARARETDLMALAAETAERRDYLSFTSPYLELPAVLIARDNVQAGLTPTDLSGMNVTVVAGYAVEEYLRSRFPDLVLNTVPDTRTGLHKVSFGISDVFISDLAAASYALEAEGISNLHIVGQSGYVYRMGIASRSDWPELNSILEKALAQIPPDERRAIYQRWIHIDPTADGGAPPFSWTPVLIAAAIIFMLILGTLWWNRSLARQVAQRTKDVEQELAERLRAEQELQQHRDALEEMVRQRTRELEESKDDAENARAMLETYANELEQRNTQLEDARSAAESANNAKSEFLANMSHEIRSPMTAILGYAEILFNDGDIDRAPPSRINAINTIRRNGNHLLNVINNILDLSKFEAGRMTAEHVTCSPIAIAWDVIELMRVRAMSKGLAIELGFSGPIPDSISTDPTRLRQILVNLVGNAIKFTKHGGVKLVLRMDDARDESLAFDVADSGIGISRAQLDKLFMPFEQADTSTTRRYGGTGLGLTISRRLASLLGGNITAVGAPGEGCTFTLTIATGSLKGVRMLAEPRLALDEYSEQRRRKSELDQHYADAVKGMRILLAEDTPDNQRLISYHLTSGGAAVDIVDNGAEAVARAINSEDEGNPYDVVLMDMQMPEVDGYEAAGLLREAGYERPIIALTAHAMRGDRERCIEAGMDDYVTKPIDPVGLCATIRHAFDGSDVAKRTIVVPEFRAIDAQVQDSSSVNAPPDDQVMDASALLARVHGSHELLRELIDLFIPECERLYEELAESIAEEDHERTTRLAHTIKGSISNFSATAAAESARHLEQLARNGDADGLPGALTALRTQLDRLVSALRNMGESAA